MTRNRLRLFSCAALLGLLTACGGAGTNYYRLDATAPATGGRRIHGEVMVASLVTLFKKLKFVTDENVGWGPIDLPELELQTTAYWLTAEDVRAGWRRDDLDVALLGAGSARTGRDAAAVA